MGKRNSVISGARTGRVQGRLCRLVVVMSSGSNKVKKAAQSSAAQQPKIQSALGAAGDKEDLV
jgi:hypothetical protein